jgi:hypothetical protein
MEMGVAGNMTGIRKRTLARDLPAACRRLAQGLRDDESGSTLVFTALSLSLLLGMAGLGLDAAMWFMTKRQVQNVADLGAVSGVSVRTKGGSVAEARQAVIDVAARNGFVDGSDGQVIANIPPLYGPNAGDSAYVEVIVNQPGSLLFSSGFLGGPVTVQARAVGALAASGSHCVLALDPAMDAAIEFGGNADAEISCGIASNSSSDQSILVDGNASLHADPAQAYGDILVKGSGTLVTDTPPQPLSERLQDPYAGMSLPPADPGCKNKKPNMYSGTVTLGPGNYCGGMKFTNADVTFESGVYVIDSGDFEVTGNSVLDGTDVTFFFTADNPDKIGGLRINGGADAVLIAPGLDGHDTGPYQGEYAGMLFVQDPAAPDYQGSSLIQNVAQGGAAMDLRGALYFPNQGVTFTGGAQNGDGCLEIIARKVTFAGSSHLDNDPDACAQQGVADMAQTRLRLAE